MTKRELEQQQKAQSRALQKAEPVPVHAEQPQYLVPAGDQELLDQQTADWNGERELILLRFWMSKASREGNPNMVAMLHREIDRCLHRLQTTALKTGAYLSKHAARDFVRSIITIASETVHEFAPDRADIIIDTMRERLMPYFGEQSSTTITRMNEKHESTR